MGRKKQEVMTVMPLLLTKQEETQTQFLLLRKSSGSSHVDGAEREEGRAHERRAQQGLGEALQLETRWQGKGLGNAFHALPSCPYV